MSLLFLGNHALGIPPGTWILLLCLILWNVAFFVLVRISNRRMLDEPLNDADTFSHETPRDWLPFEVASFPTATTQGNPLWKSVLYFGLVSFLALAVGFSVILLFGEP